jgi:hypothetical protein
MAPVLELNDPVKPPDGMMYPLDGRPTEPVVVEELSDDTLYPLEDGSAVLSPGDETG